MKNKLMIAFFAVLTLFLVASRGNVVRADDWDGFGNPFNPGYSDAITQDPTFGGRQAEDPVINPDPLPPPPAPEEGSPLLNYTNMQCYDSGVCFPCDY